MERSILIRFDCWEKQKLIACSKPIREQVHHSDDAALAEIKSELMEFCHQKQHNAVGAIGQITNQTFGVQEAANVANVRRAAVGEVVNGVTGIMARLERDLLIKRDKSS